MTTDISLFDVISNLKSNIANLKLNGFYSSNRRKTECRQEHYF